MRRTAAVVLAVLVAAPLLFGSAAGSHTEESTVDCTFPVSATDATGTTVTVSEAPERVVVLGPSAAQTMWAIGAQETVVGMPVNRYTAYLNGSTERTNVVGDRGQPVRETVVAAQPDLVLAPNIITNDTVSTLREALPEGAAVYRFDAATTLEDVAAKTELTGQLVGSFDGAATVAAEYRGRVSAIETATADAERPTVYFAMGGGWTAGTETFIGTIIETAGGRNVATAANISGYAKISQEVIAAEDPDWIVVGKGMPVPKNAAVNESTAVQEGNILEVDSNLLNQPGPMTRIPLTQLAQAFHPDRVSEKALANADVPDPVRCHADVETATPTPTATPTTSPTPTASPSPTATPTPTATTTTSNAGGPGFGVPVAVVGMVAAAGALARRD